MFPKELPRSPLRVCRPEFQQKDLHIYFYFQYSSLYAKARHKTQHLRIIELTRVAPYAAPPQPKSIRLQTMQL